MDTEREALLKESGERLAISLTVSAMLREMAGGDDRRLGELQAMLCNLLEVQLAQLPEDGSADTEATRDMFAHATAAIDRMFRMATRLQGPTGNATR